MSLKLENIPWFAVVGVLLFLGLIMQSSAADFTAYSLPVLLTQALLYICFGYAFMRGHTERGFTVFLMSLLWILTQIALWSGMVATGMLWFFCIIQLILTYLFFTGYKIKFAGSGGSTWTYAGLWVVFIYGLGKLLTAFSAGATLASMPLWGLAIMLVCFGYIIEPVEKNWALPLQVIGTLIALLAVFGAGGAGLQLLMP